MENGKKDLDINFKKLESKIPNMDIVAEDLGTLTAECFLNF